MKIRSFFIYTIALQIISIIMLWGVWLAWIEFDYMPDFDEVYNQQQEIIAEGFANTLEIVADQPEIVKAVAHNLQSMYTDTMLNGEDDSLQYLPWFIVLNEDNTLIYTNRPELPIPTQVLSLASEKISVAGEKWFLSYSWGSKHKIKVFIGESVEDRGHVIGNPVEGTFVPFLFILATVILAILITAYFSLRPLRQAAELISNRKPRNLKPINVGQQFKEIRPIFKELNQLMARIDAANVREKQFMADAAHELRTPIAAVIAQLHLLSLVDNCQEKEEIIEDMKQSLDRAAALSHQLIDLARLESDDFPLKIETLDIYNVIGSAIAQHVPYAITKNIELSLNEGNNLEIKTDKQALLSIFNNLLDNAIKYCPKGSQVEITIEENQAKNINIIVRDNGPGVAKEHVSALFSRFYRVPGSTEVGSGLGLSIAHNLANKIQATITLTEGIDNKGIGFIVNLPLEIKSYDNE
ncbi:ATP-binding protein [Proteus myxofaciens]|uniref:histidine kinase n=1 Tax=Proteus myxofaciens ATCC 19692 TaxID=1354337 RepID=A0A198GJ41_9GAMM|nr:ATP-binding protein [Proteus myxofaciens]OAT36221.1 sensory histidine kinase [Proteus myxofaciens ATCC 19692]